MISGNSRLTFVLGGIKDFVVLSTWKLLSKTFDREIWGWVWAHSYVKESCFSNCCFQRDCLICRIYLHVLRCFGSSTLNQIFSYRWESYCVYASCIIIIVRGSLYLCGALFVSCVSGIYVGCVNFKALKKKLSHWHWMWNSHIVVILNCCCIPFCETGQSRQQAL